MTSDVEELYAQQERTGDAQDWVTTAVRSALIDVHTIMPAQAVKFYESSLACDVQPSIKRVYTRQGRNLALPVCPSVPVVFPGGALTFDINPGDEGLLLIAERCIDRWVDSGGIQDPAEFRMFDLSDGFFLAGVFSVPKLLTSLGSGTELRTRDGSNRIAVRPDGRILIGVSHGTPAGDLELTPPINGLVLGGGIDTVMSLPYWLLGSASNTVMAKK